LILAGFVVSPVKVVPIIGKYYTPANFGLNRAEIGRIKQQGPTGDSMRFFIKYKPEKTVEIIKRSVLIRLCC